MDRVLRYGAYFGNVALVILCLLVMANSRSSRDLFFAGCAILPAILNFFALCAGPDLEERRLARRLNKARMVDELSRLEGKK